MSVRTTIKVVGFLLALVYSIHFQMVAIEVSSPGYFKGEVIEKTVSVGRSSTHYLYVDWEGIGKQSVVVHPVTYKLVNRGDTYTTSPSYLPLLGASGWAYNPDTPEYSRLFVITGATASFTVFFIILGFVGRLIAYYLAKVGVVKG